MGEVVYEENARTAKTLITTEPTADMSLPFVLAGLVEE
jgi:hypothetical protein